MARTKRKTNPVIPAMEAPAQAQKQYRTAAYVRLSVEDSGKPGADTIEGQKNLLLRFIEDDPTLTLYGLFCDNGRTGTSKTCPALAETTRKRATIWNAFFRSSEFASSPSTTASTPSPPSGARTAIWFR